MKMEEKIENLTDKDLLALYRLILEHLEYLETEKAKVEEVEESK